MNEKKDGAVMHKEQGGSVDVYNKDKLAVLHKTFAPTLTMDEFNIFVGMGKSVNANPWLREIFAVKYDSSKPASIFLARDFFRKVAQQQHDYDGHITGQVWSNDVFEWSVLNITKYGVPNHVWGAGDRGELVGAYCIVKKKGVSLPVYVYVSYKEYNKSQSTWKQIPATMLEKVAEAQGLKKAWQEAFKGVYSEDEKPFVETRPMYSDPVMQSDGFVDVVGGKVPNKPEPEPEHVVVDAEDVGEEYHTPDEPEDDPVGNLKKKMSEPVGAKKESVGIGQSYTGLLMSELASRYSSQKAMVGKLEELSGKKSFTSLTADEAKDAYEKLMDGSDE